MNLNAMDRAADEAAARGDLTTACSLLAERIKQEAGFEPMLKLASVERAQGNIHRSLHWVDRALSIRPLDLMALLMRATQLHALGREDEAGVAYGRALAQCDRASPPPMLRQIIATAEERYGQWQVRQSAAFTQAVIDATGSPPNSDVRLFIDTICHIREPHRAGPSHYCYPGLPEIPFYPAERFHWLEELEALTPVITGELEVLLASRDAASVPYVQYPDSMPLEQWATLNHSPDWSALHLIEKGRSVHANARHCPATLGFLQRLPQPDIPGAGPNAMFSLLAPGTHIPPHTGVSNTRLVCHLPLLVPNGCWFRAGEERREWRAGKAWVFDDTVDHEAMNPTGRLRVILIFDIWHPDLDDGARDAIRAIIAAGGHVHGL